MDERTGLLACRKWPAEPGGQLDPRYARFTFPASTTIEFIDARTGGLLRAVTRSDCVMTPQRFTPAGELVASCAPLTASRVGRTVHVVDAEGPLAQYYELLRFAGTDTVITPFTWLWRDIPKLPEMVALVG